MNGFVWGIKHPNIINMKCIQNHICLKTKQKCFGKYLRKLLGAKTIKFSCEILDISLTFVWKYQKKKKRFFDLF